MFSSCKNAFSLLPVVEMSRKFANFTYTLMRSWSNRILSVRRVTQDNQGKKTAGVDGLKSLSPAARLELARELQRFPLYYGTINNNKYHSKINESIFA
jgi:retron-type reverse transcriptase